MLWYEKGGSGTRAILLLHGLGATSGVWAGVQRVLDERGLGRWFSPDLSGHGRSDALSQYSVGSLAAELAKLVQGESELFVIGHSLGAYLGLALASRWFGVDVRGVLAIGPKISWPPADVQAAHELAMRHVRWYSNSEEAWSRYRRMSGLDTRIALADEWLRHGVTESAEGWRLSQDSRTFQVAGAPFGSLVSAATSRLLSGATASPGAGATASVGSGAKACLVLARGEHDAMVSTAELQAYCPDTYEIDAVGHNAHVEKPDEIVRLFGMLLK